MSVARQPRENLWAATWNATPSKLLALRFFAEYLAMRLWAVLMNCFPIDANLRTARLLGRIWWSLIKRHRERAMENLRPALGAEYSERALRNIAKRSFEHFAQVYLVELVMAPRIVNEWSWSRYVELGDLGPALRELLRSRGTIMLTPHFGNFELLGYTIARLGLPISAIMRPLDNPLLNHYLMSARRAGGLTLLFKKGAMAEGQQVLADGGTLCFIADQDAGRKGIFVEHFGRRASWYKSIGLAAMQYNVPIVVGYAVRVQDGFHYRFHVERIIQPEEWAAQPDTLMWITRAFADALEAAIRRHPEQYLWMHRRWKTRPRDEQAARAGSPAAPRPEEPHPGHNGS